MYSVYFSALDLRLFQIFYSSYALLWHLHPTVLHCSAVSHGVVDNFLVSFDELGDLRLLMVNIVHNFSLMVDIIFDLRMFFTSNARGQSITAPFEAGFGAGRIYYLLVVESELTEMKDPAEGAEVPTFGLWWKSLKV